MARPSSKTPVISAEGIKEIWEAEKKGKTPPALLQLMESQRSEQTLQQEKEKLEDKVRRLEAYSPTALRMQLDAILKKYGITAAFEPLIEIAMERYPDTHSLMGGQLVCSIDQRIKIWTELLGYQLPKLKAIEMAGQVDHSLTVIIKRFGDDNGNGRNIEKIVSDTPVTVDVPSKVEHDLPKGVSVKKF